MRLYTKQAKPLIAEKDITCYKVVYRHEASRRFCSEFQFFEYKIGHTYRLCMGLRQWVPNDAGYMYSGFHSFTTLKHALEYGGKHMVLLKCVIPKGTEFVKGRTRRDKTRGDKSYASKAIRFTEKLAEFSAGCPEYEIADEIDRVLNPV